MATSPPARDGETLRDERAILSDDQVELIREEARSTATAEGFMLAHGSPTAHDILLLCDSHAALRAQLADARADPNIAPERLLLMPNVREAIANLAYRVALDSLGAGLDRALEVQDEWRDVLRNPPHWTDRGKAALIAAIEITSGLRAARAVAGPQAGSENA